ncbi:MAG: hypothetical protein AB7H48_12470, partial [Parachlamydiales bacterium]
MQEFLKLGFEPIPVIWLRRFLGLFWPIFDPNNGVNIRELILTPSFGSKSRLKRTRKSTEAYYWD